MNLWTATFAFLIFAVDGRYLPENETTVDVRNSVEEIQHAVCKVATEDIQASANASITRQLRGVCSSQTMNTRFNELEKLLVREIQVLKLMLQSGGYTTPKPYSQDEVFAKSVQSYDDYDYLNEIENYTQAVITKSIDYKRSNGSDQSRHQRGDIASNLKHKNTSESSVRDRDIIKYNETIQKTDLGRAFVYYWKIYDAKNILTEDVYLTSPSIDFLGEMLHIKFSPRHLGTKYANFELVTSGRLIRIHRFVLLHEDVRQDLNSQLLGNVKKYATSFRISSDRIRALVEDDILYVKVLIYMDF